MQPLFGALAADHPGGRQPQRQDEFHAPREIPEQLEEFMPQLLVKLAPHEAVRSDIHHQRAQRGDQVKFARLAQPGDQIEALLRHHADVVLHRGGLEARHDDRTLAQVFVHLGEGIEFGREHLEEEGHRFADRQQLVGFLEEEAVMLGPQHDVHPPAHQIERKQPPARDIAAPQHRHRIAKELREVADQRRAAVEHRQGGSGHGFLPAVATRHPAPAPFFWCELRANQSRKASGKALPRATL